MVFYLKNIDDAGFGLRDSSKLGNLLNHKWRASQEAELVNVWGSCGHVFVTTNKGRDLHAFECVPRSKWTPESEGLLLQDQESPIVSVLSSTENPSVVLIVFQNSNTQCWEFTQSNFKWVKRNDFQLSNTKRVEVLDVILHPLVNSILWCERRSVSLSNSVNCCVCVRELTPFERLGNNTGVSIGPLVVILHGCPVMSLHVIGRGVCMVPKSPEELKNIFFFWAFIQRTLKVYMWNHGYVGDVEKVDLKAIVADLLCPWILSTKRNTSQIIAVTSHPMTNELLVLNCVSELSYFRLVDGDPVMKPLVKLHHASSSCDDRVSLLFAFGLFTGVVWNSGIITIYDIGSGALLCRLEDLQGQNVHVWKCFHLVNAVGFWSVSGIWKLQSGTIQEISDCIQSSLPYRNLDTENADLIRVRGQSKKLHTKTHVLKEKETCDSNSSLEFKSTTEAFGIPQFVSHEKTIENSSEQYEQSMKASGSLFTGPLFAANNFMKWNVKHRAAKLALDSIVCSQILSDCHGMDEEVPVLFLDLLFGECVQSPAMALALLWEHPMHREVICHKLEQYMDQRCDNSQMRKTCLNELLHPYINEFLLLSKQMRLSITDPSFNEVNHSQSLNTNSTDQEIVSLLETFDVGFLGVTLLERLNSLSYQQPKKVLGFVAEYLKLDSEREDLIGSHGEQRWKKIYRLDWRRQQWQRNRVAVKEPFNTILSILLRLFYDSKSELLMRSVDKGKNIVKQENSDERAEEHIIQSVLDCLPVLHTSHVNSQSVEVHAQLFYSVGQETQALHLLLSNHMWKEAIDFVSCCGKSGDTQTLLFVMLFKGLQHRRAPSENLIKALSLKSAGFNSHEILALIRDQAPVAKEPFQKGPGHTTLGAIRSFLDALFSLQSIT